MWNQCAIQLLVSQLCASQLWISYIWLGLFPSYSLNYFCLSLSGEFAPPFIPEISVLNHSRSDEDMRDDSSISCSPGCCHQDQNIMSLLHSRGKKSLFSGPSELIWGPHIVLLVFQKAPIGMVICVLLFETRRTPAQHRTISDVDILSSPCLCFQSPCWPGSGGMIRAGCCAVSGLLKAPLFSTLYCSSMEVPYGFI